MSKSLKYITHLFRNINNHLSETNTICGYANNNKPNKIDALLKKILPVIKIFVGIQVECFWRSSTCGFS